MSPPRKDAETTTSAPEPREVDRVAMVSLKADGSPDQSDGYEVIAAQSEQNVAIPKGEVR